MKPPRVRDVAALAGVSTATVSRTLSHPSLVSQATREAVQRAIEETGYTVNMAARNLRRNRTGGVLALVPNLANPFFSQILAGISSVLRGEDMNLLVADTMASPDARDQLVDYAHRSRCDGLIVLDGRIAPEILRRPACPPVIQACEWIEGLDAPRVLADNAAGVELAVEHLVQLGHRAIGHLAGPTLNPLTAERARGYRNALGHAGLPAPDGWTLRGDFTLASGQAAASAFLLLPDRPTAVICDNDEMACGLVAELRRHGVEVPGDLSVIGFDDIEIAAHVTPALTTVHQHRAELGATAARQMLMLLEGRPAAPATVVPVDLVVRGSTGTPPARHS